MAGYLVLPDIKRREGTFDRRAADGQSIPTEGPVICHSGARSSVTIRLRSAKNLSLLGLGYVYRLRGSVV